VLADGKYCIMQGLPGTDLDPDVADLEALTRLLVGLAWHSAHAAPAGVTFAQFRLLLVLGDLGRVPSSRLAAALGVNASSVTRMAGTLQAKGYLVRGAVEHNRSVVTVEVTDTGRRVVAQVLERRHAALGAVLDRMPPAVRRAVADAARQFTRTAATVPAMRAAPGAL
jgi:DNA-binding MarR family transcriptional regulator